MRQGPSRTGSTSITGQQIIDAQQVSRMTLNRLLLMPTCLKLVESITQLYVVCVQQICYVPGRNIPQFILSGIVFIRVALFVIRVHAFTNKNQKPKHTNKSQLKSLKTMVESMCAPKMSNDRMVIFRLLPDGEGLESILKVKVLNVFLLNKTFDPTPSSNQGFHEEPIFHSPPNHFATIFQQLLLHQC